MTETADLALLEHEAEGLLRAVLTAEGVELVSHRLHQVQHRPGVGVTAGWQVWWRPVGGEAREDYLLGTTCPVHPEAPGCVTVQVGEKRVTVWRHPADPELPDLATATDVRGVAGLLGVDEAAVRLELVTYRPLRRAVLRAVVAPRDGAGAVRTAFLKVVRPSTVDQLVARHRMLHEAGLPVARVLDVRGGLVVLETVSGSPLTEAFAADGAAGVDPSAVVRLLDLLPAGALDLPARPSWADRLGHHTAAAVAVLPEAAEEILDLGRRIQSLLDATDAGPLVPTHGDLHEANLLMDGPQVVGLLDVDAVGPGRRVDDLACLLGHLSVLPALAPDIHHHVPAALPRWTQALESGVDPVALRARAAAVAMSLVAGARAEDRPDWRADALGRLAAVRAWIDPLESGDAHDAHDAPERTAFG